MKNNNLHIEYREAKASILFCASDKGHINNYRRNVLLFDFKPI